MPYAPVGERGAHQLHNRTHEPVRVLVVSKMNDPEVSVYPDSRKVAAFAKEHREGLARRSSWVFPEGAAVGYREGEKPPPA